VKGKNGVMSLKKMNKDTFKLEILDLFLKEAKVDCTKGITIDISRFTDKLYENYIKKDTNEEN
jgi:hypothetical protein